MPFGVVVDKPNPLCGSVHLVKQFFQYRLDMKRESADRDTSIAFDLANGIIPQLLTTVGGVDRTVPGQPGVLPAAFETEARFTESLEPGRYQE
jgi:hypothetical protein